MVIDDKEIKKILYINLAFIGDIILSTPALRALRQKYPDAVIHMLVTPWSTTAALGNPYVNQVYEYDKKGKHRKVKALWELISMLRQEKYDVIINANFAVRGAMLAKIVGAKYRIGYDAQHAGVFLTHAVSAKRAAIQHETENQMAVLAPLKIETKDFSLEFCHNVNDIENMKQKVKPKENQLRIAICPFGRHSLKSWTIEGYIALLDYLSATAECYLIGGKSEKEQLEEINAKAGNQAVVLAGNLSIGELAAFFSTCDLLVTVDTGPMHLAGAVGIPVVAFFGWSDSRIWGPRGKQDKILKTNLECVPCISLRECSHHSCMKQITLEQVIHAIKDILEQEKGQTK